MQVIEQTTGNAWCERDWRVSWHEGKVFCHQFIHPNWEERPLREEASDLIKNRLKYRFTGPHPLTADDGGTYLTVTSGVAGEHAYHWRCRNNVGEWRSLSEPTIAVETRCQLLGEAWSCLKEESYR